MLKIIKLHTGLVKFLRQQLPQQKSIRKVIIFLYKLTKNAYIPQLLRLYKDLFVNLDPEYRTKVKANEKYTRIKKDLENARKLLNYVNKKMVEKKYTRTQQRQFWVSFYKDGRVRTEIFKWLMEEINKIGE